MSYSENQIIISITVKYVDFCVFTLEQGSRTVIWTGMDLSLWTIDETSSFVGGGLFQLVESPAKFRGEVQWQLMKQYTFILGTDKPEPICFGIK